MYIFIWWPIYQLRLRVRIRGLPKRTSNTGKSFKLLPMTSQCNAWFSWCLVAKLTFFGKTKKRCIQSPKIPKKEIFHCTTSALFSSKSQYIHTPLSFISGEKNKDIKKGIFYTIQLPDNSYITIDFGHFVTYRWFWTIIVNYSSL